jgi:hypothetical protein
MKGTKAKYSLLLLKLVIRIENTILHMINKANFYDLGVFSFSLTFVTIFLNCVQRLDKIMETLQILYA